MPAGYSNLIIESGATFSTNVELDNPDGSNLNLTGYTSSCKMRKSYYSNIDVYTLTTTINNPATDGVITISADANSTATFKPGRYVYDVEISNGSQVSRILEGIVEVRPNATK